MRLLHTMLRVGNFALAAAGKTTKVQVADFGCAGRSSGWVSRWT